VLAQPATHASAIRLAAMSLVFIGTPKKIIAPKRGA
jgi:hypothetical protein